MNPLAIVGWSVKRKGLWLRDSDQHNVLFTKDKAAFLAREERGTLSPVTVLQALQFISKGKGMAYDRESYLALKAEVEKFSAVFDPSLVKDCLKVIPEPTGGQIITIGTSPTLKVDAGAGEINAVALLLDKIKGQQPEKN